MKSYQSSSGDFVADRRADYAEMLFQSGDRPAAAELMLGALELAPGWTYGWFRTGEMHEAAGERDAAVKAFDMARSLDPGDRLGAALKLALLGDDRIGHSMPPAFVETLFDQYAGDFDAALVDRLAYRVPGFLDDAIATSGCHSFRHAVDLGCGTGLMGERLLARCSYLEGVDISAEMLKKATAKGIYDRLTKADLNTFAPEPGSADLVAAADVFMYVGDLDGVFSCVASMLGSGGLFAFSVEKTEENGFVLRESRRFAHGDAYVRELLARHGFSLLSLATAVIREDRGEAVEGLIVIARRG